MNLFHITSKELFYAHYIYCKHYNSNPQFKEEREPGYTFFADMLYYVATKNEKSLLNALKAYEERMLNRFCKKDPKAYCVMIDSLNYLGWMLYSKIGGAENEVVSWLFKEYERLFYRDYLNYVSQKQMEDIWYELN